MFHLEIKLFSPVFPFCGQFGLPNMCSNVCCHDKNLPVRKILSLALVIGAIFL